MLARISLLSLMALVLQAHTVRAQTVQPQPVQAQPVQAQAVQAVASSIDFERDVAPLLIKNCIECHSANESSGGLNLTSESGLHKGGDNGVVINQQQRDQSAIIARVTAGEMPPEKNGKPQTLTPEEQRLMTKWIVSGAAWPAGRTLELYERTTSKRAGRDWWSLQPLATASAGQSIDTLWLAKLKEQDLSPAPPANSRSLLRRLYFDLIGLPPDKAAIDRFVSDPSPDAYERVVDRLLSQPAFGQRWARYWLDLVRYAETNGYERDAVKPGAWRYRDWVIDAFNSDMPYDRFVTEQLAGDELDERTESTVVATGFLRLGTWDDEPNDPLEYQYDRLEDLVHATTTAFLGLTVKCARCHDHKFDPIPQTDYYRIAGAFWAGPVAHRQRDLNGGPTKDELGYDVLGWTDLGPQAKDLQLLKKGNVHRPAGVVAPGTLTAMPALAHEFTAPSAPAKTTRRRSQLAEWIVDERNPLPPRVMVNRLWQHLIGDGLVRSPDNFGFQGSRPTHPELLDWLAADFVAGKWSMKRSIRQIVLSQAYRQSSLHPEAARYEAIDPANHNLWRANRRRLDAEALRDSLLLVSGRLNLQAGGESFKAPINAEALEGLSMKGGAYQASPAQDTTRRSVYMFVKRSLAVPLMTVFDCCDTTTPAGKRDVTIVAPQALTLMNNATILEESRAIAGRLPATRDLNGPGGNMAIDAAWQWVLSRDPSDRERALARAHLADALAKTNDPLNAWASLCHVLINTNEFITID